MAGDRLIPSRNTNIAAVDCFAIISKPLGKAVADGPVGQVLAGPVSECNKNILIISITMLT